MCNVVSDSFIDWLLHSYSAARRKSSFCEPRVEFYFFPTLVKENSFGKGFEISDSRLATINLGGFPRFTVHPSAVSEVPTLSHSGGFRGASISFDFYHLHYLAMVKKEVIRMRGCQMSAMSAAPSKSDLL